MDFLLKKWAIKKLGNMGLCCRPLLLSRLQ
jgi:hypothetical protein